MMKAQKVEIVNVQWDRIARKGAIIIGGRKTVLDITFAPLIASEREMNMFLRQSRTQSLEHVHACVVKLFDADDTIKQVIKLSKSSSIDSADFSIKNTYLNQFLDSTALIIDPATDSMKCEAHMKQFATSQNVPPALRKFANNMESLRSKKKKGSTDREGNSYEVQIKQAYSDYWDELMLPENKAALMSIIRDTLNKEADFKADIGLAGVPVIDSEKMLEYTRTVNRYALLNWPKGEPNDNCATYIILAPEVFSNPSLMKKVIEYINEVETKFIVIKFKNLELDGRLKIDETEELKHLLEAIIKVKKEKKEERVFIALEANVQMYVLALGGFDIISTSMTGMDGDFPFRRGPSKTAINGYFDKESLIFRNESYIRKKLNNGGFKHDGCVCDIVRDYEAAKVDWYEIRREHYIRCANELYIQIYGFIDQRKIELGKQVVSNSRISNLKQAVPLLDYA